MISLWEDDAAAHLTKIVHHQFNDLCGDKNNSHKSVRWSAVPDVLKLVYVGDEMV